MENNLSLLKENAEAEGETPENGDPLKSTELGEMPMPPLIKDEPMKNGTETAEDSVKESPLMGDSVEESPLMEDSVKESPLKEDSYHKPLVSIENIDVENVPIRKKPSELQRQRKIRGNRLLRKAILPRNALMALNELKGIQIEEFSFTSDKGKYTAMALINGIQYVGQGNSKMAAKNAACEKALCDYMTHKLMPIPLDGGNEESGDPEDDKSMLNLASFALHKLYLEWESKGFPIPSMLFPENNKDGTSESMARSELPNGWETMHPVSVLCLMRPNITFLDVEASGDQDDGLKCVRITVDNRPFTANARSKKIARRMVAIAACNALFGTNFTSTDLFLAA